MSIFDANPVNNITADYKDRLFRHRRRDLVLWSTMMLVLFITCNAITKIPLLGLDIHYSNAWVSDLLLTIGLMYFMLRFYHYIEYDYTSTVRRPENTKLGYIKEELCHLEMLNVIEADYDSEIKEIISKFKYKYSKQTITTTTFIFKKEFNTYHKKEGEALARKLSEIQKKLKEERVKNNLIVNHKLVYKATYSSNEKVNINYEFSYTIKNSMIRLQSNLVLIFRAFKHRFWFELHFPFYYALIVVILYIFRIITDLTTPYCYFC